MAEDTQLGILIKAVADLTGFKQAEAATGSLTQKMDGVGKDMMKIGSSITSVGKTMSLAITAPLVAMGTAAAVNFGKFNENVQRAGAFVNATTDEIKSLEKAVVAASSKGAFSTLELSDALGSLLGGEIDVATTTKELGNIVDLAMVSKMGTARDAVDLASLALTVFKDDLGDVNSLMDNMAVFAANVDDKTDGLARALQQSAGTARAAGVPFKDLITILSVMRRSGIDMDLTWASFNAAMTNIQAPTKQAMDALEGVGFGLDDLSNSLKEGAVPFLEKLREGFERAGGQDGKGLAFLMQVLGRQAAPEFATALALDNEALAETSGWFSEVTGKGAELAKKLEETQDPMKRFQNAWTNLSTSIGAFTAPIFEKLAGVMNNVNEWFKNLSPQQQQFVVNMFAIAAAIGPVLVALGFIASAIGSVISIIAFFGGAAVVGTFIAATVLISAAIGQMAYFIIKHWDTIKDAMTKVVEWIQDKWNLFVEGTRLAIELTKIIWDNLPYYIGLALGKTARAVIDAFIAIWNWIAVTVPQIITSIVKFFEELPGKIWTALQKLWTTARVAFDAFRINSWNWARDTVDGIVNFFTGLPEKLKIAITGGYDVVKGSIKSFFAGVTEGFGELPSFDTGGIVPGPIGSPQVIIAHGGETVLPTHKSGTSSGWSGDQNVNVTINVSETVGLQEVARFLDDYLGQKAINRQFGIS